MVVTKRENYRLLESGAFGNTLRIWKSLEDLEASGYRGLVAMRYIDPRGGGGSFNAAEVLAGAAWRRQEDWERLGAKRGLIRFFEAPENSRRILQGEAMLSSHVPGLYLHYTTVKLPMRYALRSEAHDATGLKARCLLKGALTPSSFSDMEALLELYPDHAVEFTAFKGRVGSIPGRNAVIWEVRKY